jgi:hypothetical protein
MILYMPTASIYRALLYTLNTYSASGINRYSDIIIVLLKVILGMTLWILYILAL